MFRTLLLTGLLAAPWVGGSAAPPSPAPATTPGTQTYTYKQVGTLEIKADVIPVPAAAGLRPVVVWIHGGALINGGRERDFSQEHPWLWQLHEQDGVVLVSIDYRLAPESRLAAIADDVVDAIQWVRTKGPALFNADPTRVAVAGTSAGGYLTLLAGFRVKPRPTALVSFWGYGELLGPWYSEPSHQPRHLEFKPTAAEAWRQVAGPPLANDYDRRGQGRMFYQYCRQHGLWPQAVSGWNPFLEAEKFDAVMPLKNVSPGYPPTFFVHGQLDTDVPSAQSEMMAAELKRHGVAHKLVMVANGEHGLKDSDPRLIEPIFREAAEFLRTHLAPTARGTLPIPLPKP